jgi:chaperonin GroES
VAKAKAKKKVVKKAPAKKAASKKNVAVKKTVAKKPAIKKTAAKKPTVSTAVKQKLIDVSEFVTPLDDRMIVQVSAGEKRTPGGLYIPDTVSNVSGNREGVVISVGRGHRDNKGRLRPMDVKKGDKIIFSEYTGSKISYEGQDLLILRETDVMGVLD